jgi:hypothetical protein
MVSLSLIFVLVSGIFYALGQSLRNWRKTAGKAERFQIENLVAERIVLDLRCASEVLTTSSTEELSLRVNSEVISYKLVDQKVRRKKGASSAYLTSENEVNKLAFSYPLQSMVEVCLDDLHCCASARN